ncbi:MAG: sugar phosphate nucleotidyltransferase [Vicinamibacterales bacterium]|nr:sugar phosphate nucleotidyltransferase [Vicinamibacterales bacterium]
MIPAIVLAAGLATRLRPLSSEIAKAAMPVAGVPLVERILRQLSAAGITEAVLNLHHLGHTITAITGDGAHLHMRIRYSWETTVLGSGGGPCRALRLLRGPRALVLNGDTLTDLNIPTLVDAHLASGALVTLAVVPNTEPDRYGGVAADKDGIFTGLVPRGSAELSWHFVGVHVVERTAYDGVSPDVPCDSISGVYTALAKRVPGSVRIQPVTTSFVDIGTPQDYLRTCLDMAAREGGTTFGSRVVIDPSATVTHSVLWDDVVVEAGAVLDGCIVMSNVRVRAGNIWSDTILQNGPHDPLSTRLP